MNLLEPYASMKLHHARSTHRAFETRCTSARRGWIDLGLCSAWCIFVVVFFFFLLLLFSPPSFSFLLLYGTPCEHTKVERDARNGRRKLLRSGSLFDRGTEFRPGAWPLGKCVRDPRCRFPVGNGREDRFSPFNDLSSVISRNDAF